MVDRLALSQSADRNRIKISYKFIPNGDCGWQVLVLFCDRGGIDRNKKGEYVWWSIVGGDYGGVLLVVVADRNEMEDFE